jgi:hypothetical protein
MNYGLFSVPSVFSSTWANALQSMDMTTTVRSGDQQMIGERCYLPPNCT